MNDLDDQLHTEEIDFHRYWLVFRKHWLMIAVLFIVAVAAAAVSASYLPKAYRVTAIIGLGQITDAGGQQVRPLASVNDIQQMITSGSFIRGILTSLGLKESQYGPGLIGGLSIATAGNVNSLPIHYETLEPELGKKILDAVIAEIQKATAPRAENYRRTRAAEIGQLEAKIQGIEAQRDKAAAEIIKIEAEIEKKKKLCEVNVQILRHGRDGIRGQLEGIRERLVTLTATRTRLDNMTTTLWNNTLELVKGKDELARIVNKDDVLSSILFSNNLQQSIGFLGLDYERIKTFDVDISKAREQISKLQAQMAAAEERIKEASLTGELETVTLTMTLKGKTLQKDREFPAEIAEAKSAIEGLQAKMDLIEGIRVIIPPDYLSQPVRPNVKMTVTGSGGISLVIGVLVAFFLERRKNHPEVRQR